MQLEAEGHRCTSISGELEHEQRDRTVKEFRSGTTKILIATDVLSRGFDVTQVSRAPGLPSAWHRPTTSRIPHASSQDALQSSLCVKH